MMFQSISMYDVPHPNARDLLDQFDTGFYNSILNAYTQYATAADVSTSGYIKLVHVPRLIDAPFYSGGLIPVCFRGIGADI